MTVLNKHHHGGYVPEGAVNIMRGSPYGNPFVVGMNGTREECVEKFRRWLWKQIRENEAYATQIEALHGKDLCCCCAPLPCHGDVLEKAAVWLVEQRKAGRWPVKGNP